MNDNKPCRQELMNRINAVSFAVDDVKLFLDTHPCDKDAMEYFEKYQEMLDAVTCDIAEIPTTLNLEQQAYFALGYRQMTAELNSRLNELRRLKKEKQQAEETDEEE